MINFNSSSFINSESLSPTTNQPTSVNFSSNFVDESPASAAARPPNLIENTPTTLVDPRKIELQQRPLRSLFPDRPLKESFLEEAGLLYAESEISIQYSPVPPGRPDFSQGERLFLNDKSLENHLKKKILVVSHVILESESVCIDKLLFERFLASMMGQGFQVKVLTSEGFLSVEHENQLFQALKYLNEESRLSVEEACIKTGLSPFQIFELNTFSFRKLASNFNFVSKKSFNFPDHSVEEGVGESNGPIIYDFNSEFIGCITFLKLEKSHLFTAENPLYLSIDTRIEITETIINTFKKITVPTVLFISCISVDFENIVSCLNENVLIGIAIVFHHNKNVKIDLEIALHNQKNLSFIISRFVKVSTKLTLKETNSIEVQKHLDKYVHFIKYVKFDKYYKPDFDELIFFQDGMLISKPLSRSSAEEYAYASKREIFEKMDSSFNCVINYWSDYERALLKKELQEIVVKINPIEKTSAEINILILNNRLTLKKLVLQDVNFVDEYEGILSEELPVLNELIISSSLMNIDHLINILAKTPNIESLTLISPMFQMSNPKNFDEKIVPFLSKLSSFVFYDSYEKYHRHGYDKCFSTNKFYLDVFPAKANFRAFYQVDDTKRFLICLLKKTPNLQELYIAEKLSPSWDGICLPYLSTLQIGSRVSYISQYLPLLRHLIMTPKAYKESYFEWPRTEVVYLTQKITLAYFSSHEQIPQDSKDSYLNTGRVKNTFYTEKAFFNKPTNNHRQLMYTVLYHLGALYTKHLRFDIDVIDISRILTPISKDSNYEYSQQAAVFSKKVGAIWEYLPGLGRTDTFSSFEITSAKTSDGRDALHMVEVGQNSTSREYYVHSNTETEVTVTIQYVVTTKTSPITIKPISVPKDIGLLFSEQGIFVSDFWKKGTPLERISRLASFFKGFNVGEAKYASNAPEYMIINAILQQRTGVACLGRSKLFTVILPRLLPEITEKFSVNLIQNMCHAFVEVCLGEEYYVIDLGGYPANVIESPIPTPKEGFSPKVEIQRPTFTKSLFGAVNYLVGNSVPQRIANVTPRKIQSTEVTTFKTYIQELFKLIAHESGSSKQALLITTPNQFKGLIKACHTEALTLGQSIEYVDIRYRNIRGTNLGKILLSGGIVLLDLTHIGPSNIGAVCQLLDPKNRTIQGINLHPDVQIIALWPRNLSFSADLARRFTFIKNVPFLNEKTILGGKFIASDLETLPSEAIRVPLFGEPFWKPKLLENYDQNLQPIPGALIQACKQNIPLILENITDDLSLFSFLCGLEKGVISFNDKVIKIPEGFKVHFTTMAFPETMVKVTREQFDIDKMLNKNNFFQFFPNWTVNGEDYGVDEGILKAYEGKMLILLLTDTLSEMMWLKFMNSVKKFNVDLVLSLPESLSLPSFIKQKSVSISSQIPLIKTLTLAQDPYLAVEELKKRHPNAFVLHVGSKTQLADIMPALVPEGTGFILNNGPVWNCLAKGQPIIITGSPSRSLIQGLSSLLGCSQPHYSVNGVTLYPESPLMVVSNDQFFKDKIPTEIFTSDINSIAENLGLSISRIKLLHEWLRAKQIVPNVQNTKQLLAYSESGLKDPHHFFSSDGAQPVEFENRLEVVMRIFSGLSRFVYLYGPPATGKTHFMTNELRDAMPAHTFFLSAFEIPEFLEHKGDAVLCLDEGDLKPDLIEALKGLLFEEGEILHEGKIYRSKSKLVVATGNGRKKLPLINDFGGAIAFKSLPAWKIKRDILEPLISADIRAEFAAKILDFFNDSIRLNIDIDLRQLKTIAALSHLYKELGVTQLDTLCEFCFLHLYPEHPRLIATKESHAKFISNQIREWKESNNFPEDYTITPSREALLWKLICQWNLTRRVIPGRQMGILIEGNAGEGKTVLIENFLKSTGERFERIDLCGDVSEVREQLHRCFHDGIPVWIDEFEGQLYEPEVLAYTSGVDLSGRQAVKQGFMIFASANKGYNFRLPRPLAVDSRFDICHQKNLTTEEQTYILEEMGLKDGEITSLIEDHLEITRTAPLEALRPTSADLFNKAEALLAKTKNSHKQ